MDDHAFAAASELAALIRGRDRSAAELLEGQLERIEGLDPLLNAIPTRDVEAARAAARRADVAVRRGEDLGPLHGVAITLKDSHAVAGMRSTIGVREVGDRVPDRDGTVASRIRAAGAVILGKTNVASMLYDVQTVSELFGRTNNPWDLGRTPGGSSGGAAAAVAAGLSSIEVGSDLGGSVRIPAAFCGIVGFKPTEGRIPETGHMETGRPRSVWIMESISPLGRSVDDVALVFSILAGPDGHDPTVPPIPLHRPRDVRVRGLRVAVATAFPGVRVQAGIRAAVGRVADSLAADGAIVAEALPEIDWEDQRNTRRRLFKLTDTVFSPRATVDEFPLADYLASLDRRAHFIGRWERFFRDWDVLLCPVTNRTAFEHRPMGTPFEVDGETVEYWSIEPHVQPFNFLGAPAISLPAGMDDDGLPVGVQLASARWSDEHLLAIARAVEPIAGGFRAPPIAVPLSPVAQPGTAPPAPR